MAAAVPPADQGRKAGRIAMAHGLGLHCDTHLGFPLNQDGGLSVGASRAGTDWANAISPKTLPIDHMTYTHSTGTPHRQQAGLFHISGTRNSATNLSWKVTCALWPRAA